MGEVEGGDVRIIRIIVTARIPCAVFEKDVVHHHDRPRNYKPYQADVLGQPIAEKSVDLLQPEVAHRSVVLEFITGDPDNPINIKLLGNKNQLRLCRYLSC